MKAACLALVLAGCFPTRSAGFACDVTADCDDGRTCQQGFCVVGETETDGGRAVGDAPDADTFDCTTFNTRHFTGCEIPRPGEAVAITGNQTYDTDAGTLSGGASPPSVVLAAGRVISVQSFTIAGGATLRVIGSKPLLVASWSTLTIDGVIDASSSIANGLGAGSNPTECTTRAALAGQNNDDGAGGGGGGGLLGVGGRGGNGDAGTNGSKGGNGGIAATAAPLLLGGCAGAAGGTGRQGGGVGGNGGGAIQLAAFESITVTIGGKINAGGAGGAGAAGENGGGGGGGSGGMIVLESAAVTVTGTLAANGGGGGGGSTSNNNATGSPGQDAQLAITRATGGAPNNNGGGQGGLGGAGPTTVGNQGQDDGADAGGGGGGSCGFIVVASSAMPSLGGTISPVATTVTR